jgi:hypothetical protein
VFCVNGDGIKGIDFCDSWPGMCGIIKVGVVSPAKAGLVVGPLLEVDEALMFTVEVDAAVGNGRVGISVLTVV